MNTTVFCQSYNKTFAEIDEFGCYIIKLAGNLFYYNFGYICMGPVFLIILISIFGKIKENYKWFILYQAFWDLSNNSLYSCNNLMVQWVKKVPQCFYFTRTYFPVRPFWMNCLDGFIAQAISYNSYSALLLLSLSRFMALYYPLTYKKLTKKFRIFLTIIVFTFFATLFDLHGLFLYLQLTRTSQLEDECMIQNNLTTSDLCVTTEDSWYKFYVAMTKNFSLIRYMKPPIFLLTTVITAAMIFWKIFKQAKFQLQHNKKNFSNSLRIATVIGLQIFLNCLGIFCEIFNNFIAQLVSIFKLKIITTKNYVAGKDYTGYIDLQLPLWLNGDYGLISDNGRAMIIQFRILFESLIVLCILTDYREAIINCLKFIYKIIRHPWSLCKNFKTDASQTEVFRFSQQN